MPEWLTGGLAIHSNSGRVLCTPRFKSLRCRFLFPPAANEGGACTFFWVPDARAASLPPSSTGARRQWADGPMGTHV
ncbi:hypothetical protein EON67_09395 [archaeon]|nr:MAG: hypothetical protein EON67_09395 [archaeon]